ncbi:hypothetical protein [Cryobacterium sp. TMS1-20-1]|uniref:hypothetical protein n=1 Tax=Cryobacterium sp. TMS1-20-1 TaxID=1259223 RepID=UPI0015827C03|nr:hypothetical protein [Cryobacterium sp. TMS1-20-1]
MTLGIIVVCEIGFWAVIVLGLFARYTLKSPRFGFALLSMAPVIDLVLLITTAVHLRSGAEAEWAIGRLLLAHDGTWPIDGDATAELKHKLAESLWWTFVLASKLDIDIDQAFSETMSTIRTNLEATIERTAL